MQHVGIDISKNSTAMVIETDNHDEYYYSYNTNKPDYKWNELVSSFTTIRTYTYLGDSTYSNDEIYKLDAFQNISTDILCDFKKMIDTSSPIRVSIEGYNYGKTIGPIIDLVGIGTLVRSNIYEYLKQFSDNFRINIIAPKSLKTSIAELVYGYDMVAKGKRKTKLVKKIRTNNQGVMGGNFKKFDILQAMIDYNTSSLLGSFVKQNAMQLMSMSSVPKPVEDLNDAYFLKQLKHV